MESTSEVESPAKSPYPKYPPGTISPLPKREAGKAVPNPEPDDVQPKQPPPGEHPQGEAEALKVIEGNTRILLVAPHGKATKPRDDINTDKITRRVAELLKCSAIVNDATQKEECDFNSISEASRHQKFIGAIKKVVDAEGPTLVVWIHGAGNDSVSGEAQEKASAFNGKPEDLHALIGYGQGKNPRFTASKDTAERFRDLLTNNGMNTILTRDDADNYRAHSQDNMNQWFLNQGYKLSQVESLQLEIRETGFRGDGDVETTAKIIADALSELISPAKQAVKLVKPSLEVVPYHPETEQEPDDELVERAYRWLESTFVKHIRACMLEAGQYIIKEFYGNNFDYARQNKKIKGKSLRQLIQRLQEGRGDAPSKTWIYDAVNLAVDEHHFGKISAYGNLGHSQKVALTHAPQNTKEKLIHEAVEQGYTVVQLKKAIADLKHRDKLSLDNLPPRPELLKVDTTLLKRGEQEAQNLVQFHKKKSKIYQRAQKKIASVLNHKRILEGKDKGHSHISGFHDWTKEGNIVNICRGCSNDCVYCYGKRLSYRRKQIEPGHWKNEVVLPEKVKDERKLYSGRVGFPTTHDITTKNLDSYLTVLGKLLKAGNEILIVSKPRFKCIQRICEATTFFKDEILFRFTVGAIDDKILSFWEPNAPPYEERKRSLRHAHQHGFDTSVSIEPMLDSPNITALVEDLMPFVSDAIWIGEMNDIKAIRKKADDAINKALDAIEANQTNERIWEIYSLYKDNPKIKWKGGIKRIVDIEAPPAQGMDI